MKNLEQQKTEIRNRPLFHWWFYPNTLSAFFKIPAGAIILYLGVTSSINGLISLVDAFRNEPLFSGAILFIFFPIAATFFIGPILWFGIFYYTYEVLYVNKEGWKNYFKVILYFLMGAIILAIINVLVFGWAYL